MNCRKDTRKEGERQRGGEMVLILGARTARILQARSIFEKRFQRAQALRADLMPDLGFAIRDLRPRLFEQRHRSAGAVNRHEVVLRAVRHENLLPRQRFF